MTDGRKGGNGDAYYSRIIRRLDSLGRITANLVRYGASIRSDVRRHDALIAKIEAAQARTELNLAEAQCLDRTRGQHRKRLNALIAAQDKTERVARADRRAPQETLTQGQALGTVSREVRIGIGKPNLI